MSDHAQSVEQRVTPLDLFFDLLLLAFIPLGTEREALAALAVACALIALLVAYETLRFSAERARVRMEA